MRTHLEVLKLPDHLRLGTAGLIPFSYSLYDVLDRLPAGARGSPPRSLGGSEEPRRQRGMDRGEGG